MNVLSFLFARYGRTAALKNSGSLRERKKLSSWQAYLEYFSRFWSALSFGQVVMKENSARSALFESVA